VLRETIVLVTSDHGESLGEHGLWEHNNMYQDNLRIPWIMRWPVGMPRDVRVEGIVDSIDMLPTLCDLMGLEPPEDPDLEPELARLDGVSALPLVRGEVESLRRFSFAENNLYRAIQDGRWKLVVRKELCAQGGWERMLTAAPAERRERWAQRPRLFDLELDPLELENLFESRPERARELFDELQAWSGAMPIGDHMIRESARDLEAERRMLQLGYGGGVGADDETGGAETEDRRQR